MRVYMRVVERKVGIEVQIEEYLHSTGLMLIVVSNILAIANLTR